MLSTKKLIKKARKWQTVATLGRRRIAFSRGKVSAPSEMSSSMVARKGHLFVYTSDGNRFMVPLAYLADSTFRELFRMSEEEFGFPNDGPITLPCDAASMEYIISLIKKHASKDVKRALLTSIANNRCTRGSCLFAQDHNQQHPIL